jgi:hypothetical protein
VGNPFDRFTGRVFRAVIQEIIMEKEEILDLFRYLTSEDQKIVIELLKYALTLGTVDLYRMIEEFEDYASGRARFTNNRGDGTNEIFGK